MVLVVRRVAIWIYSKAFTVPTNMGNVAGSILFLSHFFFLLALVGYIGVVFLMLTVNSDFAKGMALLSVFTAPSLLAIIAAPGIVMLIPTFIAIELFSIHREGFFTQPNKLLNTDTPDRRDG